MLSFAGVKKAEEHPARPRRRAGGHRARRRAGRGHRRRPTASARGRQERHRLRGVDPGGRQGPRCRRRGRRRAGLQERTRSPHPHQTLYLQGARFHLGRRPFQPRQHPPRLPRPTKSATSATSATSSSSPTALAPSTSPPTCSPFTMAPNGWLGKGVILHEGTDHLHDPSPPATPWRAPWPRAWPRRPARERRLVVTRAPAMEPRVGAPHPLMELHDLVLAAGSGAALGRLGFPSLLPFIHLLAPRLP